MELNSYNYTNNFPWKQQLVPHSKTLKLFDRNHQTHLFVGNSTDSSGDHTVYSAKKSDFNPQNFEPRTSLVIIPTNDGYYQLMDLDHQALLFVGHGADNGGDHTVYACPGKQFKDHNDMLKRTAWEFIPVNGAWRLRDRNHGCYMFVGNGNDGGDHTLYAVPENKFSKNQNEWHGRTLWDCDGAKPVVPINKTIRAYDINHETFLFLGNASDTTGDHTVYSCKLSGFQIQNFEKRTGLVLLPHPLNGKFQLLDNDHQAYLFVGHAKDNGGDHTVYACPQKSWKDHNDFLKRTAFNLLPAEDNLWRIQDCDHNSFLFIGNGNDGGDHTVYAVPEEKFHNNSQEFGRRTLFYLS